MSLRYKPTARPLSPYLTLRCTPTESCNVQICSPKPPYLRSTPNGSCFIRVPEKPTCKPNSLGRLKTRKKDGSGIAEDKGSRDPQRKYRRFSPSSCSPDQLQQEISLATRSALRSVENFHSKKHAEVSPFRYSPLSSHRAQDSDSDLADTAVAALSRREKTPTKRDLEEFFRSSLKYGDGIGNILRREGLEDTWKPPKRKSIVLHVTRLRRSETPLAQTHAVAKAQSVLQTLRGRRTPNC